MRILVTDGETRAALAVTRSLGRAGHDVLVGARSGSSLAQASRYCVQRIVYPDPVTRSEDFIEFLIRTVEDQRVEALVPVADIATFLITRNRARFPLSCAIPFADAEVIARAANKIDTLQTAERLGVPVPRSVVVASPYDVPDPGFGYPVVIKPHQSRVLTAAGWVSSSVSHAKDREALIEDLAGRPCHEFPVMLQERIVGPGVGVFVCYRGGRPLALFSHRRLRERPPWGGVSVLSESAPVSPTAAGFATRLLDEIGWDGVAMVEFKLDERDGLPKLMEINGRFWGSLQLAIDAGVDFPALLVGGGAAGIDAPGPYRVGVRNRWFWGDVDSLLASLFGGRRAPAGRRPGRFAVIRDFMKFRGRNLYYDNPKWDDPWPWLVESREWFGDVLEGALQKQSRRSQSPGLVVLVRHLIGYGLERGRRALDFTLGDDPFKSRFTNALRKTVRVRVFRNATLLMVDRARRTAVKAVRKMSGS